MILPFLFLILGSFLILFGVYVLRKLHQRPREYVWMGEGDKF